MIKCKICNHEVTKDLSTHLRKVHNLSGNEYLQQFPDAVVIDKSQGFRESKITNCKICGKECKSLPCHLSKSHKMSMNEYTEMYEGFDSYTYVKCKICGHQATNLVRHIKSVHNMTKEDYLEQFPDASLHSEKYEKETIPFITSEEIRSKGLETRRLNSLEKNKQKEEINKRVNEFKEIVKLRKELLFWMKKVLKSKIKREEEIKKNEEWKEMTKDWLECKLCGKRVPHILSKHIIQHHNMLWKEYEEMFPESKRVSEDWTKRMTERNKSREMRNIIIERNKTEKQRNAISQRNKDSEFRKKCKEGIKNSLTWHDVHSVATTKRNLRLWKDPEYAKRMLDVLPSKYGRKQKYYSEYFNIEFSLKSNSEKSFVELCEYLKVSSIQYEGIRIQYEWLDGSIHNYYPDFIIEFNDEKFIVEVKWDESFRSNDTNKCKSYYAVKYCEEHGYKYCWFESRYHRNIRNFNDIVLCRNKNGEIAWNSR